MGGTEAGLLDERERQKRSAKVRRAFRGGPGEKWSAGSAEALEDPSKRLA